MEVEHTTLWDWVLSLTLPGVMLAFHALGFALVVALNPFAALSLKIEELRSKQFAMCWKLLGGAIADDIPSELDTVINEKCRGRVLDIGPGSGFQLKRFKSAVGTGKVKQIYGVEPGKDMHDQLRAEASKVFGKDANKYQILSCGAQPTELIPALAAEGSLQKSEELFDTIVCIRVLCGIPQPQETIDLFYRLLKPGGSIIFLEHVVNSGDHKRSGSIIALLFQRAYMLAGWSFLAGGCELTRDTAQFLRQAAKWDGGWAQENVRHRKPESCISEIWGCMVKRGGK